MHVIYALFMYRSSATRGATPCNLRMMRIASASEDKWWIFIHLFIDSSIYRSINPCTNPYILVSIYLFIHASISTHLSIYLSIYLYTHRSIDTSIYLSIYTFFNICLYIHTYTYTYHLGTVAVPLAERHHVASEWCESLRLQKISYESPRQRASAREANRKKEAGAMREWHPPHEQKLGPEKHRHMGFIYVVRYVLWYVRKHTYINRAVNRKTEAGAMRGWRLLHARIFFPTRKTRGAYRFRGNPLNRIKIPTPFFHGCNGIIFVRITCLGMYCGMYMDIYIYI